MPKINMHQMNQELSFDSENNTLMFFSLLIYLFSRVYKCVNSHSFQT